MSWYVVYSKPRLEACALENIQNQGFEAFCPQVRIKRRRNTGTAVVLESMFPRYLFVNLEVGVNDFSKFRSTRGCIDLVRFGGLPKKVPDGFVEALSGQMDSDGILDLTVLAASKFAVGQKVRVAEGAFEGLLVEIAELRADDRALVLMEVMGGARKVVVPMDQLDSAV
ncbi:MAG: transcriptional activator RfaH [Limnobacter sp.]|nr:transcriptional activator RfaH [Limnobacter sp.]